MNRDRISHFPQITFKIYSALIILLYLVLPKLSFGQSLDRYEYSQVHMGTDFQIILYAPDSLVAQTASDAAYERIKELDQILSDYQEDSELNRLSSSSGSGKAVPVSDPLFYVINKAVNASELTDGAFDMTIGPFVKLWRITRRTQRLPSVDKINKASESVGYNYIELDESRQTVKLQEERMQLDAGGIGKGYAVDEALAILRDNNISSALIKGGGDIVVSNAPPNKKGWTIEVGMIEDGKQISNSLTICDKAISTSGDLFQYVELDGARYSHIINPQTGLGLTNQSKVTVIAPDGITADSYSSAISVMGPEKGINVVHQRPEMEFYFISKNNGKYKSWQSSGFKTE
ncbi:MAG: FAD:protein FMN transferase [Balneolales bacterium]